MQVNPLCREAQGSACIVCLPSTAIDPMQLAACVDKVNDEQQFALCKALGHEMRGGEDQLEVECFACQLEGTLHKAGRGDAMHLQGGKDSMEGMDVLLRLLWVHDGSLTSQMYMCMTQPSQNLSYTPACRRRRQCWG